MLTIVSNPPSASPIKLGLLGLFSSLWLLDTASTIAFVAVGGIEQEANPVMRSVMLSVGMGGFALIKAAALIPWTLMAKHIHTWIHAAMCAIMLPVVFIGCSVAWY